MEEKRPTGNAYEFNKKDFFNSFISVMKTVLVRPNDFYQHMPVNAGYAPPFFFLIICLGVSGILALILNFGDDRTVVALFAFLFFQVIFSFITAGILHMIAQQFFEGKGGYQGMYRTVAYAGVVHLVTWIPVMGIIPFLYGLYLQMAGLERVHKITTGQAVVTVLIAFALYGIMALIIADFHDVHLSRIFY
jgi:hypothetical protein